MVNAGASIEALLTLDATGFNKGIDSSLTAITKFKNAINSFDGLKFSQALTTLATEIPKVISQIKELNSSIGNIKNFDTLSLALSRITKSLVELSSDSLKAENGINILNSIFEQFTNVVKSTNVTLEVTPKLLKQVSQSEKSLASSTEEVKAKFTGLSTSVNPAKMSLVDYGKILRDAYLEEQRQKQNLEMLTREFNQLARAIQQENSQTKQAISVTNQYNVLKLKSQSMLEKERLEHEKVVASITKESEAMMKNGAEKLRNMGYTGRLAVEEAQVRANSYSTTTALEKQSMAHDKASASANRQTTATNRLGRAMSSLRMIGTMVASMMVYNFAHSLITATRETVNAKSEMEGYFKMLHFNQTEIGNFNKALDNTVGQFKRINKYALGETISSIGVEFNLTTAEMEKAMPVVSMITSEYLRAGRNVNEASLAVKDILQGEFQRLSRETGVKGDQLKEAGWSGDKKDVMGLLEALDTVGKSRNWDVFVTKANSLNDAVLILQNRFSEWTADMVNVVQPSILNVFNTLMSVGGLLSGVLEGAWKWLSGEGLANNIVRWTGLATAITGVATALIHYRTGANLVQMVQMGLRGSIMATVFGLKAEEVATYGSRNAILSKITSLKAEQVANLGVKKAIATKVLGLNAELVAQKGVKGAIMSSVYANQLAKASEEGANAEKLKTIALEQQEQLSKMGTLRTIFAKIAGVNMETFAERGLIVALAQRIAQTPLYIGSLKAEEIAELSTAEAGFILMSSLLPLTAILVGLAVAIYGLVKPLQDASEGMKKFNTLVNDGDNIIKTHKKTYDGLVESYNATNEELQGLEKNSKKYLRVQDKLNALDKDKATAQKNWENSIKAVEMARSRQAKYDEEKSKIAIHNQTELADAYIKAGISSQEAYEMASHELTEATEGAEQLRRALQEIKFNADKSASKTTKIIEQLTNYGGISKDRIKEFGKNMSEAQYKIAEGLDKFMTSEDLMERIGGWFELQQGRLEEWWTELNAFFEMRDWDSIRDKLWEGFKYILDLTPLGGILENLASSIQEKGLVNTITDALFGEGDTDGAWDIFCQWANGMIIEPARKWILWFLEDPVAHFGEVEHDVGVALAKFLFGKQSDGKELGDIINEWFKKEVLPAIGKSISKSFTFDNLSHAMPNVNPLENIIKSLFVIDDELDVSGAISKFIDDFIASLTNPDTWLNSNGNDPLREIIAGWFSNLESLDFNQLLGDFDLFGKIVDAIFNRGDNGGESTGGSTGGVGFAKKININIGEWLNSWFGVDLQEWINNFPSGIELPELDIGGFLLSLFNLGDGGDGTKTFDFSWIPQAIYDSITGAISDWTGSIDLVEFVTNLIPPNVEGIYQWAMDNIITPLVDGIKQGVLNTPVLGNVASLLGFGDDAETESQESGQTVGTGFTTGVQTGLAPLDGVINTAFKGLNLDDITANFTSNTGIITTNATSTATSVANSYATMKNNQKSSLDSMVQRNTTAFQDMHTKSHTQMLAMRDSTSNVTSQMTDAWRLMKDNIVASANKIKTDSKSHFDTLSGTIKSFYQKIQNPSQWGSAGSPRLSSGGRTPNRRVGRAVASTLRPRGYAGGSGRWTGKDTMSVSSLKRMICPNGDCGNLFDGLSNDEEVDVRTFLSMVGAKGHGFGGWNFADNHNQFIKTKSDAWKMGSPVINLLGGIQTSAGFKVGEFNDGKPKITWEQFQSMAEAIFSAIPYKFYYDSSWKGSWLGALQSGACNCYDGALALIAFANACGFGGSMAHGTWTDPDGSQYAHVWAVINGKKMDTTGWQQRGSWSAGSPNIGSSRGRPSNNKTVNVTVDMQGATIYGVDDLDSKIRESVQKGLQEEFNDSYSIAI